jgi:NADP-dependent 3-hydroxy acid dehydrogenase YdfG
LIATDFAEAITCEAAKAAVRERLSSVAIPPDAIARGIAFAIGQAPEVDVGSIVIRPTAQD